MINFKDRDELPISVVMVASLVIIAAAALFMALAPNPAPSMSAVEYGNQKRKANSAIAIALKDTASAKTVVAKETWPGTAEEVLPLTLQKVATIAKSHNLKIIGFHPQNVIAAPSISLVPLIVNVDGPFISVIAFERDIEAPGTNLTVNLMQLATADQESNKVTASVGIVAYQPVQSDPATTTGSTPASPVIKPATGVKKSA